LKQHIPWFDEECLGLLDQRNQAKVQWLQDPSQSNVDNLNNVRCGASRHFRDKEKEYWKAKIEKLETTTKVILGTFIGLSVVLRRFASLELMLTL
jgi:hypothetical protein